MVKKKCFILELGNIGYEEAFALQKRLVDARRNNETEDTLMLLEHPPVFTVNRKETLKNILVSKRVLEKEGVNLCQTDRGGDVTYHGPGQVVGYSIMDLTMQGKDLHQYIRNIEQVIINTLREYGIASIRDRNHPGVWVGSEKIAAVGIAVKRGWISMHGFSLNVNPNMKHYRMIVPCGILDKGITSMTALLSKPIDTKVLHDSIIFHYGEVFHCIPEKKTMEDLPWL